MSDFPENIEQSLRLLVPYGAILFLFILNMIAPTVLFGGSMEIPFTIMAIYYWSAYRPTLMPVWLAFTLGILLDSVTGVLMGLNALVFVCVRWRVTDQRLFLTGQPFQIVWLGFFIVCALANLTQWALFGLLNLHWIPIEDIIFITVLSAAFFPPVSLLLHASHKILPAISGSYKVVQ